MAVSSGQPKTKQITDTWWHARTHRGLYFGRTKQEALDRVELAEGRNKS